MRLAERLRQRLAATAGLAPSRAGDTATAEGTIPAAVLVAIVDRREPGLILTQRPETMRAHAGQVAFPGGRVDPGDRDAIAAALREAEEEVALPPAAVDVVGTLPPYHTVTHYAVTPVLGVVPPDLPLVPAEDEVAAVFEVPLDWALRAPHWTRRTVDFRGEQRSFSEAWWEGRRVWGATAAMLANIAERIG